MPKCKAKAKSTGKPCQRDAMKGRTTCWVHGGSSPRGSEHPSFKHGRYIKHKDTDAETLGQMVERNMLDSEYLSMQAEVSLFRSRLEQIVERIEALPTDKALPYRLAKDAHKKLLDALERPDAPGAGVMLQTGVNLLGQALGTMAAEYELWGETRATVGVLRDLVGQETTRYKIERDFLKAEDAVIVLAQVRQAVLDIGLTPEQKQRFAKRMEEIMRYQPVLPDGKG